MKRMVTLLAQNSNARVELYLILLTLAATALAIHRIL